MRSYFKSMTGPAPRMSRMAYRLSSRRTSSGVSSSRPLICIFVDHEPDLPLVSPWVFVSIVDLPRASEMYLWVLDSLPPRYNSESELPGMVSHESLNCSLICAMF